MVTCVLAIETRLSPTGHEFALLCQTSWDVSATHKSALDEDHPSLRSDA